MRRWTTFGAATETSTTSTPSVSQFTAATSLEMTFISVVSVGPTGPHLSLAKFAYLGVIGGSWQAPLVALFFLLVLLLRW